MALLETEAHGTHHGVAALTVTHLELSQSLKTGPTVALQTAVHRTVGKGWGQGQGGGSKGKLCPGHGESVKSAPSCLPAESTAKLSCCALLH